jgi:uncharacterized protein YjiK
MPISAAITHRTRKAVRYFLVLALAFPISLPAQEPLASLDAFHLDRDDPPRFRLSRSLEEISGLAMTDDGRLLAHDDERGIVYVLDFRSGDVVKRFQLGRRGISGDFEGIATAGDRWFLVTSRGTLLEFREGADRASVDYRTIETPLRRICEVEGLAVDRATRSLLIPCKDTHRKSLSGHVVIFAFSLDSMTLEEEPRYTIPFEVIDSAGLPRRFHPSAIEWNPGNDSFVLVSAAQEAVIEVGRDGQLKSAARLSRKRHPQPEGITFSPAGELLLADEGGGGRGTLTVYAHHTGSRAGS